MTAPAARTVDLTLDACEAFRADREAQEASPADAPRPDDAAATGPPAAWLLIVTSIERAAGLTPPQRPAHFRRARAVWDEAAEVVNEPRYAEVGARLARWRAADPTLPLVKGLLWAIERPEAAGYTHLALAGCSALATLLPADDVRRGYVLAQSARALRTLGDLEGARERYEVSERIALRHRDRWLRVRSVVGLGATYGQLGNYPAARPVYERILRKGAPDPRFVAVAHHGLVLAAIAAKDWDAALRHGWHLLGAARRGLVPRVDVLLLMAGVCRRIGRYRAALSAAREALHHCVLPEDPMLAHKIMAEIALDTNDRALGLTHAATLRTLLHTGAGPFEDAKASLTLGLVEERWGSCKRALADISSAYEAARAHHYHELVFTVEPELARLQAAPSAPAVGASRPWADDGGTEPYQVTLSSRSRRIVSHLAALDVGGRASAVAV